MSDKTKDRPEDQKMPVASSSPPMHDVAAMLLESRKQLGIKRYGQPLQAFNSRNCAQDVLEEALDVAAYSAQLIWEQTHPDETYIGSILQALYEAAHGMAPIVNFRGRFVPDEVLALLERMQITIVR